MLFTLLFAWLSFAADTRLRQSTIQCIFENPLEVGASVTGRVGETIPGFSLTERALFGVNGPRYRGSPSSYFISHYRKQHPSFIYSRFKEGEYGPVLPKVSAGNKNTWRNLAYAMTNEFREIGAGQTLRMLEGDYAKAFNESSIVVGIDLFYWDSIRDNCGFGMGLSHNVELKKGEIVRRRSDTEYLIQQLTAKAKASGKTLVLGTLPYERPDLIPINSRITGIDGFWYPQDHACVTSINATLRQFCHIKDNCYLMDFGKMAERLYNGEKLPVKSEGVEIDRMQARPDGVHLSHLGSKGAAEEMIALFEKYPPSCPASKVQAREQESDEPKTWMIDAR